MIVATASCNFGALGGGDEHTVSKSRLGADCGSDHELLIAKFRLKLKKVGKTTRPFTYDLKSLMIIQWR